MQTDRRCTSCVLNQLHRSALAAGYSETRIARLMEKGRKLVDDLSLELPPNIYSTKVLRLVFTDGADPFRDEKQRHNQEVKEMLPAVREVVEKSANPEKTALLAASMGNIIDLGTQEQVNAPQIKETLKEASFNLDHSDELLARLKDAKLLVYVADNAGEVLLDGLCADVLNVPRTYFVAKEAPILNDVTRSEMIELGFPADKVLSTGTNDLGVNWEKLDPEVRKLMQDADAVIAKGHANLEGFIDGPQEAFLIFKVKCGVTEMIVDRPVGSLICLHYEPHAPREYLGGDPSRRCSS